MQTLTARELEKLIKFCGLFSSHHPAEIASVAVKAQQLLSGRGLSWRDVLRWPLSHEIAAQADTSDPLSLWPGGWRSAVAFALSHTDRLTRWERDWPSSGRSYSLVGNCGRDCALRTMVMACGTARARLWLDRGGNGSRLYSPTAPPLIWPRPPVGRAGSVTTRNV
jgi:hypothetical protein